MKTLSPAEARELIARGALLVDVRDADEHARSRIAGARNQPMATLERIDADGAPAIIYHCRSGNRTAINASRLAAAAGCDAFALAGGIDGWRAAGLPVIADRSQPLELMRQVQIAAGALVLLGVVLGHTVAPAFLGLAGFVGAGLMFAGASGWCGMARLLAVMPWNRTAAPG